MWSKSWKTAGEGFTLLEVLLALVISGVFLTLSLRLLTDQWRGSLEAKRHLELQYSVLSGGRVVVDAVRTAKSVVRIGPGVLKVVSWADNGTLYTDLYYIGDKDYDGIKDLYCEHLNVPNPVATRVTGFVCEEEEPGLWRISLEANWGGQKVSWETLVHGRTP
ncbi:MAG: prepilin-type N-terminal cleavage/methylation domain-containing protein [Desulfitobacteriaceae bacterium]